MATQATAKVVDLSNVSEGSGVNPMRQPAGDYSGKIISVEDAPAKTDNIFQWKFVIKVGSGTYAYYCKLQENQLWKLRNLFVAAGKNVPKKKVRVDPNQVVGKIIGVTLEDDEYKDKLKSNVAAVFPASELEDQVVTEDEDDEYEDEEDYEEEEPAPVKSRAKAKPAPEPEEDEEEYEDEEEEEEEEEEEPPPPPVRKKRPAAAAKKAAAPARKPRRAAPQVSDDELEELDIEGV